MKKKLFILIISILIFSCNDSNFNNNNPYLPNYTFTQDINMNLPAYSNLLYPSNAVFYSAVGIKGIIIFNTGNGYNAFDAACPNQTPSACTSMTINGIEAVCSCDKISYNLFTGLGGKKYPLKQYRVEVYGNVLRVYN